MKRTTPSDVEQKLLVPVLSLTGVARTTYSLHFRILHVLAMLNRYPDFVHQLPAVQVESASEASTHPA